MNSEYTRVPTFDYSSAFSYKSSLDPDVDYDLDEHEEPVHNTVDPVQKVAYGLLVTLSFLLFVVTIPVSSFFCIKKIDSLQRCLTHRLGRRLPLKGPGFIVKLPFVDHITIIDLFEDQFFIIENEEQLMTSDGSIIVMRPCQASLNVTNAVLTTLKIGDVNVKSCLQLHFANMIRSKHVEDLENKIDFIMKLFEENSNRFLKKWGYSIKLDQMPRFTVIERADPINPIKNKLQKLFRQDENGFASKQTLDTEDILNFLNPIASLNSSTESSPTKHPNRENSIDQLVPVLQTFVNQYKNLLVGYQKFNLKLTIKDLPEERVYYFKYNQGIVETSTIPKSIQMKIDFANQNDFDQFLVTKDTRYLNYSFT